MPISGKSPIARYQALRDSFVEGQGIFLQYGIVAGGAGFRSASLHKAIEVNILFDAAQRIQYNLANLLVKIFVIWRGDAMVGISCLVGDAVSKNAQ